MRRLVPYWFLLALSLFAAAKARAIALPPDPSAAGDGTWAETLYYTTDANRNVTSLVDTSGNVVERTLYDAYGKPTFYAGSAFAAPSNTSGAANEILFAGYRYDPHLGIYHVRHRVYDPLAGRWIQTDPTGYFDSMNLYEYCQSNSIGYIDPNGMAIMVYNPSPELPFSGGPIIQSPPPGPIWDPFSDDPKPPWLNPPTREPYLPPQNSGWFFGSDDHATATGLSDPNWRNPGPGLTAGRSHDPGCPVIDDCDRKCEGEIYGWGTAIRQAGEFGVAASGLPVLEKPRKGIGGAPSPQTSYASKYLSKWFPQKLRNGIPAPTLANPGARTATVGRFAGRVVPVIGTAALVWDVTRTAKKFKEYVDCVSRCKAKLNYRNRGMDRYDYGPDYRQI